MGYPIVTFWILPTRKIGKTARSRFYMDFLQKVNVGAETLTVPLVSRVSRVSYALLMNGNGRSSNRINDRMRVSAICISSAYRQEDSYRSLPWVIDVA